MRDDHGDDPVLIRPGWKGGRDVAGDYPYEELMGRNDYEVEKYLLQIELLKFQYWVQDNDKKHVIVFEDVTPPGRAARSRGSWNT